MGSSDLTGPNYFKEGQFFSDKDEDEASSRLVLAVPAFESLERSLDLRCRRLHLRVGQVDVCKVRRSVDDELCECKGKRGEVCSNTKDRSREF